MCGVIGLIEENINAPTQALTALKEMEYRGYDSWGVAWASEEKCQVKKQVGKIGAAKLDKNTTSSIALGHTRWATHGGVTAENAHPHISSDGRFALVHNGVVENFLELKKQLLDKKYLFKSQTDTEVILGLFELEFRKNVVNQSKLRLPVNTDQLLIETLQTVFLKLSGSNAVVIIDAESKSCLAVRHGSPLLFAQSAQQKFVVSDLMALIGKVKKYATIPENTLLFFTKKTQLTYNVTDLTPIDLEWHTLSLVKTDTDIGTYSHFFQKEIADSSAVLLALIHAYGSNTKNNLEKLARSLGPVVYLVGCGSAYHAALYGAQVMTANGRQTYAFSANEFLTWRNHIPAEGSVIFISQSGETADILIHTEWLKNNGISYYCLVNKPNSSLSEFAKISVSIMAGVEQAVVASKSFVAQLCCLQLLAGKMANKKSAAATNGHLTATAKYIQKLVVELPKSVEFKAWCLRISKKDHFFVLGRETLYPIALETALKLKEAAYVHAEGFSAGELKHGVLALVENGTECLCLATNQQTFALDLTNAMEISARQGNSVGLVTDTNTWPSQYFNHPDFGVGNVILSAVFGQLLAYEVSILKGIDSDKPRNLAKSVTVR